MHTHIQPKFGILILNVFKMEYLFISFPREYYLYELCGYKTNGDVNGAINI